jgi:hypothetical protein
MYIAPNGKLYTEASRFIPVDGFQKIYLPFGIVKIVFASEVKPNLN